MAHTQHIDLYSGEDRTITLYARDSSNAAASLTGKTLTAYIGRPPLRPDCSNAEFTLSGTITGASTGTYTITVADTDTDKRNGDYEYMVKTVDGSGLIAVVTQGRFRIRSVLTS